MKNVIIFLVALAVSIPAMAVGPAPKELQGGVITVTLKDGKTYTFSSDEYAVVKRGSAPSAAPEEEKQVAKQVPAAPEAEKRHKNILSIGVVRSQKGFETEMTASTVDVTTQKKLGAQLQYQRNVTGDLYFGVQADTNGGVGVSAGKGF